jgi:5-methylcytosine-specific restriction endonuclease McrA
MGRGGVYVRRFGVYRYGEGPKSCLTCSKPIKPTRQQMHALRLEPASNHGCFCSKACAGKWKQCESGRRHKCHKCNRKTGWHRGSRAVCEQCRCAPAADVVCNCKQCGGEFTKRAHDPKQYCNSQCWGNWKKDQRRTNCKKCGVSFIPKKSKYGTYCSRACAGKSEMGSVDSRKKAAERQRSHLIRVLNWRAVRDEKAWAAEQPKRCKCGKPVSHGRRCRLCRRAKRYDIKKQQNKRYRDFYRSGVRDVVIARDRGVCQYCGRRPRNPTVDHMLPVTRGGTNDETNLVVACKRCNCIKCDRMPLDLFNSLNWIEWKNERALNKRQGTLFR